MIEVFETEGPRKISISFHEIPGDLVKVILSGSGLEGDCRSVAFTLDFQEFKSFLKAGLRFDERWSEKHETV